MSQLSRAQAEAAYDKVIEHYAKILTPDDMPVLVHDWEKTWDSPAPVIPWAIVWHCGPDSWAIDASHNDIIPAGMAFAEPASEKVLALYPA